MIKTRCLKILVNFVDNKGDIRAGECHVFKSSNYSSISNWIYKLIIIYLKEDLRPIGSYILLALRILQQVRSSLIWFGFHYSKDSSLFIYKTTFDIIVLLVCVNGVLITRSNSFLIHQLMNKPRKEFSLKNRYLSRLNYV